MRPQPEGRIVPLPTPSPSLRNSIIFLKKQTDYYDRVNVPFPPDLI
jgi:hypothetical protein